MRYTLLRLTSAGIVLCAYHLRRLELDTTTRHDRIAATARAAFVRFAREAEPGVWAVQVEETGALRTERRTASSLHDDMPVRFAVSPLVGGQGPVPKPASPGPYDAVRRTGVTTLLTSGDARELYEACRAAVLSWDGTHLLCASADRPRVWSTAEAAVRERLRARCAPLLVADTLPLLLVNAVKGTCSVAAPEREAFPAAVRSDIEQMLAASTGWPS